MGFGHGGFQIRNLQSAMGRLPLEGVAGVAGRGRMLSAVAVDTRPHRDVSFPSQNVALGDGAVAALAAGAGVAPVTEEDKARESVEPLPVDFLRLRSTRRKHPKQRALLRHVFVA